MASDTLVIKHLPVDLTASEKEELLKHFGAVNVKCLSSKHNKYNLTFARFTNAAVAENVLHRLHQLQVSGRLLSVEYAKGKVELGANVEDNIIREEQDEESEKNEQIYRKFIDKLNSWHSPVEFRQPVPAHLKYQYPPPTAEVLLNIAKVLATVPKFYTQVLHLMNKMSLPCPFGRDIQVEVDIGLDYIVKEKDTTQDVAELSNADKEDDELESESEISSDEDITKNKEIIPQTKIPKLKKSIKRPKFVKLTQSSTIKTKKTKYEDVFEKPDSKPKKIKLSYPSEQDLKQSVDEQVREEDIEEPSHPVEMGGFGRLEPIREKKVEEPVKDSRDEREEERLEKEPAIFITSEELAANRIPESERGSLTVFKNYSQGVPSCRLYIKNLAKTVTEDDLKFIYTRYLVSELDLDEETSCKFEIRLMKEGRMKGQAFVTLQTTEQAKKALEETNGFIIKDKPMVVQYGRVTATAK